MFCLYHSAVLLLSDGICRWPVSWNIISASFLYPLSIQNISTLSLHQRKVGWEVLCQLHPSSDLSCKCCDSIPMPCWMKRTRVFLWASILPVYSRVITLMLPGQNFHITLLWMFMSGHIPREETKTERLDLTSYQCFSFLFSIFSRDSVVWCPLSSLLYQ